MVLQRLDTSQLHHFSSIFVCLVRTLLDRRKYVQALSLAQKHLAPLVENSHPHGLLYLEVLLCNRCSECFRHRFIDFSSTSSFRFPFAIHHPMRYLHPIKIIIYNPHHFIITSTPPSHPLHTTITSTPHHHHVHRNVSEALHLLQHHLTPHDAPLFIRLVKKHAKGRLAG